VLYSLLYAFAHFMIDALIYRDRSNASLQAEVLALRHQLPVLERQTSRPGWQPTDRLLLADQRRPAQAVLAIVAAQPGDAAPLASGAGSV
jgi:hypothetical protein